MDADMFDFIPPNLIPSKHPFSFIFFFLWFNKTYHPIDITSSITYNTNPNTPLTNNGTINSYHDINDTSLIPLIPIPQPVSTKSYTLSFGFDTTTDGTNHAFFNDVTFNYPLVPTVFSEVSLGSNASVQQAYGPLSIVLDHLEVFDIVIQNTDAGKHPL